MRVSKNKRGRTEFPLAPALLDRRQLCQARTGLASQLSKIALVADASAGHSGDGKAHISKRRKSWGGKGNSGQDGAGLHLREPGLMRLLLSSSALIAAGVLGTPALAENCSDNSNCALSGIGSPGAPAPDAGQKGGDGGFGGSWTWEVDNVHYVEDGGNSPLDVRATGGEGARGADGHISGGKDGGDGGKGGDAGPLVVTTGAGTSGTTNGIASGITIGADGGEGGGGAYGYLDYGPGTGGTGGTGGQITANLRGTWPDNAQQNSSRAMDIWSLGGAGGSGRTWTVGQDTAAPKGGTGGQAGAVDVTLGGTFHANRGGVRITSTGGVGGVGGDNSPADSGQGGDGGTGGDANTVDVTVESTASISQTLEQDAGLMISSVGGAGGHGGPGGASGGNGGTGGNAKDVVLTLNGGVINAAGVTGSPGILVQSLGGNGGNGGSPSQFVIGPQGGSGANGGRPGTVTITGSGANIKSGNWNVDPTVANMAPAVLAQSIGGGGGGGGNASGWFSVGGNAGNAIAGNDASVSLSNTIITAYSTHSDGIAVQSIGGGGGKGGNAKGTGVGLNMVIGGTGGQGGNGGSASANSGDGNTIETTQSHSSGVLVQSIGGGGGTGGAAYSKAVSAAFGASMSLGGTGGNGGNGGNVQLLSDPDGNQLATNSGRIRTFGSDSHGILAQSIGGGGGVGGASTAAAQVYGGGDVPSIALTMALGGNGGKGGDAGSVTATNTGLIQTAGSNGAGMVGQAIGGGGGSGGDASASATASGLTGGEDPSFSLTASFALGGKGNTAGHGGQSSLTNDGFIITRGESADGTLAQSVGGGGGSGGAGDAKASSSGGKSLTLVAALGAQGGAGGDGDTAAAMNGGSVITLGDGANGVAVQSIGGGGGRGGGAAGSTTGDYSATLTMGGDGSGGGSSYRSGNVPMAKATNAEGATILTFGGDANGLLVQSIGGGGGAGGKSATSLGTDKSSGDGGNGDATTVQSVINELDAAVAQNGMSGLDQYKGVGGALDLANRLLGNDSLVAATEDDTEQALDDTTQSKGETDDENKSKSIHLEVAVGGSAGPGGSAGGIVAENDGTIATMGHHSDGILAQAIGGGGGKGGAASTATSGNYTGSLSVGGSGGNGGYGGWITVNNTGTIYTKGAVAAGIVAQSISGGGGVGGASASSVSSDNDTVADDDDDGYFKSASLSLGGDGGSAFSSGQAMVTSSGLVSTTAHDSIGIVAQSIAGGGGILKTLATDKEGAGGSASAKGTDHDLNFAFGGAGGSSVGSGYGSGYVSVTTQSGGTIRTTGDNSHGILAQSISGGGGVVLGGTLSGSTASSFFGTGSAAGSVITDGLGPDTNSGLVVNVNDTVATIGAGAVGVFAQSIGGGGGLAGDIGHTMEKFSIGRTSASSKHSGNGGEVHFTLGSGARITTTGPNAPGVILQSVGGGGGWFASNSGAYIGSAGGSGTAATVDVEVNGAIVTTGYASMGIFAQSAGGATNGGSGGDGPINVTIGETGSISVGQTNQETPFSGDGAAIYVSGGTLNTVTNNGTVKTYGTVRNAVAVMNSGGDTQVTNNGTMWGDVLLTNGGGTGCFTNNGSYVSGDAVTVGTCGVTNAGAIEVGQRAEMSRLAVDGDYKGTGQIIFDADFAAGAADRLDISGDASFGGEFVIRPTTLRRGTVEIARVGGDLDLGEDAQSVEGTFFTYGVAENAGSLSVTPEAAMRDAAEGLGDNREAVAAHLEDLWNAGVPMDRGFAALAAVDADEASATLDMLSGQALGLIGASRYASSQQFVDGIWSGCTVSAAGRCGWGTWTGSRATMDDSSDAGGYEARAWGFHIGGAQAVADNMTVGGAIAYENLSADDRVGFGSVDGDSVQLGGFVTWAQGDWRLSGAAEVGRGWFDTDRRVAVGGLGGRATGSTDSWHAGLHGRAAWHRQTAWGFVEPRLDVSLLHVRTDGFTEKGASPFNLAVEKTSDTTLIVTPGIAVGHNVATADGSTLKLTGSLGYALMSDDAWSPSATLASGVDSFEARTALPDRLLKVGLGAELVTEGNTSFSAAYRGDFGSGYDNHTAELRVDYRF